MAKGQSSIPARSPQPSQPGACAEPGHVHHPARMRDLGRMYEAGDPVPMDSKAAWRAYRRGCHQGGRDASCAEADRLLFDSQGP